METTHHPFPFFVLFLLGSYISAPGHSHGARSVEVSALSRCHMEVGIWNHLGQLTLPSWT